jgi:DNA-binding beta-propeller fold protein YncE
MYNSSSRSRSLMGITAAAITVVALALAALLTLTEYRQVSAGIPQPSGGLVLLNYRNLQDGPDGIALIDLDPESDKFGQIVQQRPLGTGVLPHHIYFSRDESRLYNTALGGPFLYEIKLQTDATGAPHIGQIISIDTQSNIVAEDIYFSADNSRYYVTFMGGRGELTGGSIGVFDGQTNELLDVIVAPAPDDFSLDEPFIMYPHGISANEELGMMMVTSTLHPDTVSGAGNTVTLIDMATHQPLKTYLVADSPENASVPVEVLLLRDGLPPFALVSTLAGDVWVAGYDEVSGLFGEFEKKVDAAVEGLGVALEFYIYGNHQGDQELYISFGVPGIVNVYSLDNLPELTLKRTLPAGFGAHHMVFFDTKSGREVVAIQNNLLNIDGINAGTLSIVDIYTGELLATVDLAATYGFMPESIESAFGHGHDMHH